MGYSPENKESPTLLARTENDSAPDSVPMMMLYIRSARLRRAEWNEKMRKFQQSQPDLDCVSITSNHKSNMRAGQRSQRRMHTKYKLDRGHILILKISALTSRGQPGLCTYYDYARCNVNFHKYTRYYILV